MSTVGTKRVARKVADRLNIDTHQARQLVSEAIIDLGIERQGYHTGIRNWEISLRDGEALEEHLVELNTFEATA